MYPMTFRQYLRATWFTWLCVAMMIGGAFTLLITVTTARAKHEQDMASAPCIDFNGKPIQEVPARCFQYFTEHK